MWHISVHGWRKNEIFIRAKVTTNASSRQKSEDLAKRVSIDLKGVIEADGPRSENDHWYSVSYDVFAPVGTRLDLNSTNGGISIEDMASEMRFETRNGGITLTAVSGDVSGSTTNGGISVKLKGDAWVGRGLDLETTNGSVSISVPDDYSAELETGTVNGSVHLDFPVMVEGQIGKKINATLGDGGPTIRAVTVNGSVRIKRS